MLVSELIYVVALDGLAEVYHAELERSVAADPSGSGLVQASTKKGTAPSKGKVQQGFLFGMESRLL